MDSLLDVGFCVGFEGSYIALVGSCYILGSSACHSEYGYCRFSLVATLGALFEIYRNFLEYASDKQP
jgi:hypothetical protein